MPKVNLTKITGLSTVYILCRVYLMIYNSLTSKKRFILFNFFCEFRILLYVQEQITSCTVFKLKNSARNIRIKLSEILVFMCIVILMHVIFSS